MEIPADHAGVELPAVQGTLQAVVKDLGAGVHMGQTRDVLLLLGVEFKALVVVSGVHLLQGSLVDWRVAEIAEGGEEAAVVAEYELLAVAGGGEVVEHTVLSAGEAGSGLILPEHYAGLGPGTEKLS